MDEILVKTLLLLEQMFPGMTIANDDDGNLVIYTNRSVVIDHKVLKLQPLLQRSDWGA